MRRLLILLFVLICAQTFAQDTHPPFWQDIQNFKRQDSLQPPPQHAILFVGSSSLTKWTDVQDYFPGYTVVNRGFGGSTLSDLIRYEDEVIFKYKPKQIVIYCGENDAASSDTVTGKVVFERFQRLFTDIRKNLPGVPVVFISLKPAPSRWHLKEKEIEANHLIKSFLKKQKKAKFVSVWKDMLNAEGQPNPDIFIEDNLHMNAKGYAIWQKALQPYLLK
jgi:lysophospholipase L1-like esterase